jgi:hypothetical protein
MDLLVRLPVYEYLQFTIRNSSNQYFQNAFELRNYDYGIFVAAVPIETLTGDARFEPTVERICLNLTGFELASRELRALSFALQLTS